jgi:ribosome biogenesis SPOUT family RNA methylase Rps3
MRYLPIDTAIIVVILVVVIFIIFERIKMEEKLAEKLADPFITYETIKSYEMLPEGGMKIVLSNGRKLWFNSFEVWAAKRRMK